MNCCGSDLSSPSFTRISWIASFVAGGPAKYAAGAPGSARVSRKATRTTPPRLGVAISRRLRMTVTIRSPLRQRAIVEPAVEPVLVAADFLLHRDVGVGLEQRDARNVGEGEIDEALHVLVVGVVVAF